MAVYEDREHFIPLRVTDLVNFLVKDRGPLGDTPLLSQEKAFRRFARLLMAYYHIEYYDKFRKLKDEYAPLDPDADTLKIDPIPVGELETQRDRVFTNVGQLLEKANYKHLSRSELLEVMEGASLWGLEMHVDWSIFDRVEVYYRGDVTVKRSYRSWKRLWMKREVEVPTFKRLVIMIKQSANKGLPDDADTDNVFIKLFKNMPKMDLEMVLPGTRPKLSKLDRAMITYPIAMGIGFIAYKFINEIFFDNALYLPEILKKAAGTSALLALFGGYAYRSYYSWSVKQTTYTLQLTKSLYFQSLDSNLGVLHRILDDAEEQEVREAILAYYYLWRYAPPGGWNAGEIDDFVEKQLETKLNITVDFEIEDAIGKLERLHLLHRDGDNLTVPPLEEALKRLESQVVDHGDDAGPSDEELLSSLKL